MNKIIGTAALLMVSIFVTAQHSGLKNGQWRAVLQRKDGNEIAFNFDVKDSAGKKIAYIRNAAERLLVDDIVVKLDSVFITLPFFDSQIRAAVKGNGLSGVWAKRLASNTQLTPFTAFFDQSFRFKTSGKQPSANITGRWAVVFSSSESDSKEQAVGEFIQQGNILTGTFLNPTGDSRYLEGVIDGDSLKLSCFDGGHAFLFTAKVNDDHTISGGEYFSGPGSKQEWTAARDANAQLPDEFGLTKMKPGQSRLDFSFKDTDGKIISLSDARFKNKVVIIQIMGSWCPNCMDETGFLSRFYEAYKSKGVEVIGLAYERSTDFERSRNSLRSFQQRFNVKYPVLITGVTVSDSRITEKTLPQLEKIEGFPTTIFIGRNGTVEKIHTGFNGPGTGEHYEQEKKTFYKVVDAMLQ